MARTLEDFIRNLRRGIGQSFSKTEMKLYGQFAIDQIVDRTRKGFGVRRTGDSQKPLKKLSPGYIKYRKKNRSKLHSTTSPSRSNLTFSGKLLDSMTIKELTNNRVTWGPNRRLHKGGLTNEQLGEIVAKQGRPFNHLSKQDIKKLLKLVDSVLQSRMRRL